MPGREGPLVEGDDAVRVIAEAHKPLKRLSVSRPLTARGLSAVGKIAGLEGLAFGLAVHDPAEIEPLAQLKDLRLLSVDLFERLSTLSPGVR